jgi:site-specific recombinase XerD
MNSVRFYLGTKNQNGTALIVAKYSYRISRTDSRRLEYTWRRKIPTKLWDKKRQRPVTGVVGSPINLFDVQEEIRKVSYTIESIYLEYRNERKLHLLTIQHYRSELDKRLWGLADTLPQEELDLVSWSRKWLTEDYSNSFEFNANTLQNYNRAIDLVEEFQCTDKIYFEHIDLDWAKSFRQFLANRNYADATMIKYFERLKSLMRTAHDNGLHTNDVYLRLTSKKLKLRKTPGFKIYITVTEIKALYECRYTRPALRRVVDLFVAACYLGTSYADMKKINKDYLIKNGGRTFFEYHRKKKNGKGIQAVVPVHPVVMDVIQKYDGYPPVLSDTQMLTHLKNAAREAGFDSIVRKTEKGKEVIKKRHECFGTHTARNSFNSNMLAAGIPERDVKKMMAHSLGNDMTNNYDRRDLISIASQYSEHPFFNNF